MQATWCPKNRPNEHCKFLLLQGPLSFHTLLLEGSHFLCFQRDVFQASRVGTQATAACRSPTPAVIPGGKRAGRNVPDKCTKEEASCLIFQRGVEAKHGTLGESSRSSEKASRGLFIAQEPHWNPAGRDRPQQRSRWFVTQTQAELSTPLFLPPPHLASD